MQTANKIDNTGTAPFLGITLMICFSVFTIVGGVIEEIPAITGFGIILTITFVAAAIVNRRNTSANSRRNPISSKKYQVLQPKNKRTC